MHCTANFSMMLRGVTVVPAMVWLAVCVTMVGATSYLHPSRLTPDQYAPLISHRHGFYRSIEDQPNWKDQGPAENQSFDPSIGPRRSMSADTQTKDRSFSVKYAGKDLLFPWIGNSTSEDFSYLLQDKQLLDFAGQKLLDQNITDRSTKSPGLSIHELPPESDDPFVADDTFQDQGPGSVEIYKLDLLRERPLLNPIPMSILPTNGKSKVPKKTSHSSWETKTMEYKTTSPRILHKQSNSFDDHSSDAPLNSDPFSIGGVPELQVGCEGLEATNHKQKRSIDSASKDQEGDLWAEVTPISLDLDFDLSEEKYEEIDELVKLKKLETSTRGLKQNRGDMEATLYAEFQDNEKRGDKLPVRGDLGKSSANSDSASPAKIVHNNRKAEGGRSPAKVKRSVQLESTEQSTDHWPTNQVRKILWAKESITDDLSEHRKPLKRATWGFGEDEGVVSSDELQTENQRRRLEYERRRKEEELRRQEKSREREAVENGTNMDIERIRSDYAKLLAQKQEEERRRELHRSYSNRRQMKEEHRRRLQEEELRNQWLDEERRRQEASRRELESRSRDETSRLRAEAEARSREQEQDRRNLENRRREWWLKRQEQEEEERRKQARGRDEPSSVRVNPNEGRSREQWEREQKLREYIQRNRPINVNSSADWRNQEANRRRLEEERKLQDYIRRNQPIQLPKANASHESNWQEHRRRMQEAAWYDRSRYPSPGGGRRDHGPSAMTNVNPRSYAEEARRRDATRRAEEEKIRERERLEQEQLRREASRREEEVRRIQSSRYEEQRKRLEAERRKIEIAERHAGRTSQRENMGSVYGDRRRFEEHRRRQETSLVPANLVANEARRATELQRQRVEMERRRAEMERRRAEMERRRAEAEIRRVEQNRAKEARENQERARATKEQWRRQEAARLNALPVSARIIIRPGTSSPTQVISSRAGFGNEIEFTGFNPQGKGLEVPNFPAPPTQRPPVKSPPPCVWAVAQCCSSNNKRLVTCFESAGCPGINWDPNPCRIAIIQAAKEEMERFYEEAEKYGSF
ncbi:uncharacterized protein LOC116426669 isoform X2 [Nomia melanderi]|uniref:uncharacterized protein LOC116426669 isoform X2 n=1 Tax=Nomia melanderi TaxID=2448451 RepID=UPI0013047B55|nr:trichohyalin-like isoform X2 [Nomia melanderi]